MVQFDVIGPWQTAASPEASGDEAFAMVRRGFRSASASSRWWRGVWLARRNLRAGRADLRGAWLVGTWSAGSALLGELLSGHHSREPGAEWARFQILLALTVYWAD